MPRSIARSLLDRPQRWLEVGLNLIFPPRCTGCGRLGDIWCRSCLSEIRRVSGNLCLLCGVPVQAQNTCLDCKRVNFPLRARSFAWYQGPLVKALLHIKYKPNRRLAELMAEWLFEVHHRERWPHTLIVPVPLGQLRSRQRGYNQADLIASELARKLVMPYNTLTLRRAKETSSQVGLSPTDRRRNVHGAFRAEAKKIAGKPVLVVDDLFTTGSTLSSCADALLEAGAESVFALTVARTWSTDADGIH